MTRIRGNADYRVIERRPVPENSPITSDQTIRYASTQRDTQALLPIRRIGYRDPNTQKHYVFISNQFDWEPQTIADIYQQRWQVELFFKWIKQNLKIKTFLGTSKNAVLTQVMVALCTYLVLAYIKFTSKTQLSLQQLLRLLHTNLFIRRELTELILPQKHKPDKSPQLTFNTQGFSY